MGKDREGTFHPGKGKPSGQQDEGMGMRDTYPPESLERDLEVTDRYTKGEDELAEDIHVLHRNRNTNKKKNSNPQNIAENESDKTLQDTFSENFTKTVAEELATTVSKEQLNEIAAFKGNPCITIYMSTHRKGMEVNEKHDLINFKNNLQEAEKMLKERGVDELMVKKMLKPGYDLLRDDTELWNDLSNGLAVFIADDYFKYIKTDFSPAQEVLINTSFFIAPMIEGLSGNEHFYLLVMSKKQAKFYRGDRSGLERIQIDEIPNGVEDVVHLEEKRDETLFRTGGKGGTGSANFHGIGGGQPDEKTNIALYLEEVDDTIWKEVLHDKTAPLLLAGIEYMIPIYKEVTDYNHIWPDAIVKGALEHEKEEHLHEMAMEKMRPWFTQARERALNEYFNQSATALTSTVPSLIIPSAYYSRVKYLFVQRNAHIWGQFNAEENKLHMHGEQGNNDECLVNNAAMKTLQNGGTVFFLSAEEMPDNAVLAAVLRY